MGLMQLCRRIFRLKEKRQPKEDDPVAVRYYINLNTSHQISSTFEQLESWFPDGIVNHGSGFIEIPFYECKKVEIMMKRARIHFKKLHPIYSSPVRELLESRKATILFRCVIWSTFMTLITTILFVVRFIMTFL